MKTLLTFNAGSSTVKIGLFALRPGAPVRIARGMIDFHHDPLTLRVSEGEQRIEAALDARPNADLRGVLSETVAVLGRHFDLGEVAAVGHRVVHGGDRFAGPVRLDGDSIAAIDALTVLAPLHQPQSLRLIRAIGNVLPDLPQVASFDTAFHRTNDALVRRFAIPRALHDRGIKRYGFHGLSYKYIATKLARLAPETASGRVVVAHLGSGASLCGLDKGISRDTSMGFSTLDGIPMATRCGALDPGVVLHLLGQEGLALREMEDLLYHESGLLGVSGISADSRDLLESDAPEAKEAIDLFTLRITGEVARLATTLGGLDAIVFTAGVGENQPAVRAGVCERLGWFGLDLDPVANAANAVLISTAESRTAAFVIPTDEEQVIAEETVSLLEGAGK
ncbi:acetate/propionate family kinase [Shinella kummerowiae]|jgi:acetate kinase|uniref:Acetate kinase n=1 Tax=Shinella kummerowiae TaxID=417745 RepID=A0A6N8SJS7_9HYPH|nr:acetate/propionate family kinase [Shinella kummerowiae]MCT7668098.1 acetate/propionate family kinase [Shinella kummerowiae]MXN49314.1 acetate/propionate family kinase [Shinella kummerowiae]